MTDFTDDELSLFATAELGENTRSFLGSDIGKYLVGCATQEIESAGRKLLKVAPTNVEKINELQMQAQTASNFLIWINEAIGMGDVAHQQITNTER